MLDAVEAEWAGLLHLMWEKREGARWSLHTFSLGGWRWRLLSLRQGVGRMSVCYWIKMIMKSKISHLDWKHECIVHEVEHENCRASTWGLADLGHYIPWVCS